jgi:hypothetical protein
VRGSRKHWQNTCGTFWEVGLFILNLCNVNWNGSVCGCVPLLCLRGTQFELWAEQWLLWPGVGFVCCYNCDVPSEAKFCFWKVTVATHWALTAAINVGAGIDQSVQWLDYRLDSWWIVVGFPAGAREFSLLRNIQTGSVAHPASYSMAPRDALPWDKATGAWSWPLTSITWWY